MIRPPRRSTPFPYTPFSGPAVVVAPPAFVTAIGPSTAAFGTVTFKEIPPTPTMNTPANAPHYLTDYVPVYVLPDSTMWSPAFASFGAGSPVIVGRTFNVVGLFPVPFALVALTVPVRPVDRTSDFQSVAYIESRTIPNTPNFAVGLAPVPRKFDPLTVTG